MLPTGVDVDPSNLCKVINLARPVLRSSFNTVKVSVWATELHIRYKKETYSGYTPPERGNILCGTSSKSGSPLMALDQGADANIKKTIASFCDFPLGQSLRDLLKVEAKLF